MVATTTAQITWLVKKFKALYPELNFQSDDVFLWRHKTRTVHYDPSGDPAFLLHETGHALLNHQHYELDVDLVQMEAEAWGQAKKIAQRLQMTIDEDLIQDSIDTYRDWLHARSTCPNCQATGLQISASEYNCLSCRTIWKVNQAKDRHLRRYIKKPTH